MNQDGIFTIKEEKIVEIFNQVVTRLKEKNNFEDRFICLNKKLCFNYDRLKKLYEDINVIYQSKQAKGLTKEQLEPYIKEDNIDFIKSCIKEHDDFSFKIKEIFNTKSSYVKTTIKEKADLYIKKIIPVYEDDGLLGALKEIILNDCLQLPTLNFEYFDNLVTFALVDDRLRLKNSTIFLRDIFSLSKILMCYQMLLYDVSIENTYPTIFGDNKEQILLVANGARYINNIKPAMLAGIFAKKGLTKEQIKENMDLYIKYYEQREQEKDDERRQKKLEDLENEVDKCSIIIDRFIKSKFSDPEEYFTINRVDRKKFYRALQVIEEHKHPTFEKYTEKLNIAAARIDFHKILDGIENGVEENGRIRKFDLTDYYQITKIPTSEAKRIANRKLPYEDYLKIHNFDKKYKNDRNINKLSKEGLFQMSISFQLNDGLYKATDDDKRTVLLMLADKKIPLTLYTFKIYLRKYVSGRFTKEEIDKVKSINDQK